MGEKVELPSKEKNLGCTPQLQAKISKIPTRNEITVGRSKSPIKVAKKSNIHKIEEKTNLTSYNHLHKFN
jgi:hypothetical protein